MLRAADTVHHGPSNEDWTLACDEMHGQVMPLGWPETLAQAADCTLIQAATDEARIETLVRVSRLPSDDLRGSWARHQLSPKTI